MLQSLWAFAGLVGGFGFLIFVHELGHFLAAKAVGIKVTQFAIGFGHAVLAWRRGIGFRRGSTEGEYQKQIDGGADEASFGETEYRLNWMPLGGYVKMLGQEDLNPEAVSEDDRSFGRKPAWARTCVICAGVVMNMIFGVVFFVAAFMAGVEFPPAIVGHVQPESAAATAYAVGHEGDQSYLGLRAGDRVVRIDGEPVIDFADVAISAALAGLGETLEVEIERDGQSETLLYRMMPKTDKHTKLLALGVGRPVSLEIGEGSPGLLPRVLRDAGVTAGMRVASVEGEPVERYDQYNRAVVEAGGRGVVVRFVGSGGSAETVDVTLRAELLLDYENGPPGHLLGLVPATGISGVVEGSAAQEAGIRGGDVLAEIGSVGWPSAKQVINTVQGMDGDAVQVSVYRDGEIVDFGEIKPDGKGRIGIMLEPALWAPVIRETLAGSAVGKLNLNRGSRIVSVNGHPVVDFVDIRLRLGEVLAGVGEGEPVDVGIGYELNIANSEAEVGSLALDAQVAGALEQTKWVEPLGGSGYRMPVFKMLMIPIGATNPVAAIRMGLKKTKQFMLQTYVTVARLFQGTVKVEHLRGPVGITDEGTRIAKQGWAYLMFFLGLISVNLAVINFLPIPIVDGGLMVLLVIEKLKGSPVSLKVQAAINYVGLALIGTIFLMTLYHDVARLLQS